MWNQQVHYYCSIFAPKPPEESTSICNHLPSNHKLMLIPPIPIHPGRTLPGLLHFVFVSPVFHIGNASSQKYQHITHSFSLTIHLK